MGETFQEEFWSGEFGDNYTNRNRGGGVVSYIFLFSQILRGAHGGETACELGANIGLNLMALHVLLPQARLTGVEINQKAADELAKLPYVSAHHGSIYETEVLRKSKFDFVFTKGVLIHQAPDLLPEAYELLHQASRRYIMVCEYYNPTPVEVDYRGNAAVLFKRDFAGEMLERYPDLELVDYGFVYHRDWNFPQDDLNWFLMRKG